MLGVRKIKVGEKTYHIAINWNSICGYLKATGSDSMSAVADIANLAPSQLTTLIAECIKEGERMSGNEETDITPTMVGEEFGIVDMTEFITELGKALNPEISKKKEQ